MFCKVNSAAVEGIGAFLIQVEADISDGLPMFNMVGYLSSEVREAKERVRTAIKNSGFSMPPKHITVNLSPADVRKAGTAFDLPIAVAVMTAFGYIPNENIKDILIAGELSLNGEINRVNGILPIVCAARDAGIKRVLVPKENLKEGAVVSGIEVYGISHIQEAIEYLLEIRKLEKGEVNIDEMFAGRSSMSVPDMADIAGQESVKRAMEVAVSGQHNILLAGAPGTGKTMLAKRVPGIMPDLTFEESLELTKIYSVSGKLKNEGSLITERPFRSPHHTISGYALIGGGRVPLPGEVSLASHGVLFLDELPEFDRAAIESLRQPLEDGYVTVSRVNGSAVYPARFMLVASMNNCPCGYFPDRRKCTCTAAQINRYRGKISQPILDRIDICVDVYQVEYGDLKNREPRENSETIRERVKRTHGIQLERYKNEGIFFNSELSAKQIEKYCVLNDAETSFMQEAYKKFELSSRGYHRVLRCARTIADMEESEIITVSHLAEALGYRGFGKVV